MKTPRILRGLLAFRKHWNHFWMRETYPHIIGIVRLVMGGWLLFYWGIRIPNVDILYSTAGSVFPKIPTYMPENLLWILEVPEPSVAYTIYTVHLIALACVTIGLFTRTGSLTAFFTSWYYFYISHHLFHTSYDRLYIFSLLFLALSGGGEIFSVEAWQKYGSPLKWKRKVSIFSQRMFAFQITMTYFGVGFQKLWLPGWQGGEMLWYSLLGVWGTPAAFAITSYGWSPAYHVMVNIIKAVECFMPIGFWIKRGYTRWYAFGMGVVFHVLVDVLLYIWWFAVLIPAYIVYFEPEEVYKFLKKVSRGRIR